MASLKEQIQGQVANPLVDRLAELEANEQGTAAPVTVEEPQVVEEKIGLGKPAFNSVDAAKIAMLERKRKAVKDSKLKALLTAQIKVIEDAAAAAAAAK